MIELTKELYSTDLSDNKFEDVCTQILSKKYGCLFQRFGRQGQCQYGIDAYTNNGIYAQFKNYRTINSKKQFIERIQKDFSAASEKFSDIQKFIVVTHLNRDTFIQQKIKDLNCCIEILFWEDIEKEFYTLEEKHARTVLSDILDSFILSYVNNRTNKEENFCSLFRDVENELNQIDGYMISIETIGKINKLCELISQRNTPLTFQYQPQLLLCYNDLRLIVTFIGNSDIYQNRNPYFFIIDNSKVDFNQQEKIKSDFLKLKNNFYYHSKAFFESIAGQSFRNDSDYDHLDLSGL